MRIVADAFRQLLTPKNVVREMPKNSVSEDPSRGIMINGSKHICNLTDSSFTIFIDHCEGI